MRLDADGTLRLSPTDLGEPPRLRAPDAARAPRRSAASSSGRTSTTPTARSSWRKGDEHEAAYLARLEATASRVARMLTYDDEDFDAEQARRDDRGRDPGRRGGRHLPGRTSRTAPGAGSPTSSSGCRTARTSPWTRSSPAPRSRSTSSSSASTPSSSGGSRGGCPSTSTSSSGPASGRRSGRPTSSPSSGGSRERFLGGGRGRGSLAYETTMTPWPVDHCGICDFRAPLPRAARATTTTSSLVAGLGRLHAERLARRRHPDADGARARRATDTRSTRIRPETFERLRHQAALQLHFTRTGERRVELLPDEEDRGFRLLPPPVAGRRLARPRGPPVLRAGARARVPLRLVLPRRGRRAALRGRLGARPRRREGRASSASSTGSTSAAAATPTCTSTTTRRTSGPRSGGSWASTATREDEIDDWLAAGGARRPLPRRQAGAARVGVTSYSIKEIEKLYGFERTAEVTGGDESVVLFEQWLETGEDALLDGIRAYNEEDCRSTVALHEWLLGLRPPELPWRAAAGGARADRGGRGARRERARAARGAARTAAEEGEPALAPRAPPRLPPPRGEAAVVGVVPPPRARRGRAASRTRTRSAGSSSSASRSRTGSRSSTRSRSRRRSTRSTGACVDPATENGVRRARSTTSTGLVTLQAREGRAPTSRCRDGAHPAGRRSRTGSTANAVARFARAYLDGERVPRRARRDPRAAAAAGAARPARAGGRALARRELPLRAGPARLGEDVAGREGGGRAHARGQARRRHLAQPQGDPQAARRRSSARRASRASRSAAARSRPAATTSRFEGEFVDSTRRAGATCSTPELQLVAGTSWLFARAEFDGLPRHAVRRRGGAGRARRRVAVGHAARNLVLLGDPNQLPQVSQGAHARRRRRRRCSQHLLGDERDGAARPRDLPRAHVAPAPGADRVHLGDVLRGPARARPTSCASGRVAAGDGLVFRAGRRTRRTASSSPEEADAVARRDRALLGTPYTDEHGAHAAARLEDVLVVAPYNAQVRALRQRVPEGVRVGTVDKFQGQEAPVVFFSMASSSGEDVPRGLGVRLQRATASTSRSRARSAASSSSARPRLLEADCKIDRARCGS